jgi:hypothetical protein
MTRSVPGSNDRALPQSAADTGEAVVRRLRRTVAGGVSPRVWIRIPIHLATVVVGVAPVPAAMGSAPRVRAMAPDAEAAKAGAERLRDSLTRTAEGAAPTVYLVTFGPGEAVWERFGHNALWIHDPDRGTDVAYHYGVFDFREADFIPRLLRGRMRYAMGRTDAVRLLDGYAAAGRSIWIQELDLTPAQVSELRGFLEWNARPENRHYRYDYFRDNCSTRIRDALDRVLGGEIHRQLAGVETGTTYRFHSLRLTNDDFGRPPGKSTSLGRSQRLNPRCREPRGRH